ncbi:DUF3450 domain-containing protein [Colwelliaceae bacterium BS250]
MNVSKPLLISLMINSALLVPSVSAEENLNAVVDAGKAINTSASKSQQKIDGLNTEIQTKLQQFKTVNKEIDGLTVYNQQMQRQLNNQLEELEQLDISMQQVAIMERQISPLMSRMIMTLEQFVALDVPFLKEERSNRISSLKEMMDRADVSVAEKFRRVLEAYQVETDYGRTIEAYTGLQTIQGNDRDVDFLRVGRVSLIFQSRDGAQMGLWDQESRSWQELPLSMRTNINKGLRIARKQLAPDLMVVPIKSAK